LTDDEAWIRETGRELMHTVSLMFLERVPDPVDAPFVEPPPELDPPRADGVTVASEKADPRIVAVRPGEDGYHGDGTSAGYEVER
jgi:hypothetical protein